MKCHEWIGSISWNFISLCLHLCSSAVVFMAQSFTAEWTGNSLVCLCCGSRSSLCRGQTGRGFNGVLPTQACFCTLDKALSVCLTQPALVPLHIAQVIAFIIVQPRQGFQKAIRGRGIPEEGGRQRFSLAWETIQSLATSSLRFIWPRLLSHMTTTCEFINQNNKYYSLTKKPTSPLVTLQKDARLIPHQLRTREYKHSKLH